MKIRKAIIPIAGLGTRFLPLSKVLPKEFFPLLNKPVIQYILEEAVASGIEEVIFVNKPQKKEDLNFLKKYFSEDLELEDFLREKNKTQVLKELENLEILSKKIKFSQVFQQEPLGDGNAILQAEKLVKGEPFVVLFGDDVVDSKEPCLSQLIKVYEKYNAPVVALFRLPKEKLSLYGIVRVKEIAPRVYQIKEIVEKPNPEDAPSDLAIVGKYVVTPEAFEYLKERPCQMAGETKLVGALEEMIKDDKMVLGYEFEGEWLECGNKVAWLESNLYLSLKNAELGPKIKNFINKIK